MPQQIGSCERETTKNVSNMTKNILNIFGLNAPQLNLELMELPAEQLTKNRQKAWHFFRKHQCKLKGVHASQ
ncbi:MAG TPA: hypothetical protein VE222_11555 [Nitrospiraceae bacterium]|nr:hypothetical protein [Nitrospiraceae bacterium]